jgi:hypothetical protein
MEQMLPAILAGFTGVRLSSLAYLPPFSIEQGVLPPLLRVFLIDFKRSDIFFRDFCLS